jgi:hypothetical protein
MKRLLIILAFVTFSASTCNNENQDCHYNIRIKNNSSDQIISAIPIRNPNNKCRLDGVTINSQSQYDYRPFNFCIEESLNNNSLEIFIVDKSHFNATGIYYACDSIEIKNTILKHYVLTLEDLKSSNFTITYP